MMRIIILLVITLFGVSCHKECNEFTDYLFEIPATLYPAKDTFRVGDTITITSVFSDEVYDRTTQRTYKLENIKFYPGTAVYKIDSKGVYSCLGNDLNFIYNGIYDYNIYYSNSLGKILIGQYSYVNNRYKLEVKLNALKKGTFLIEQNVDLYFNQNLEFDGRCPEGKAGIDAFVKMNEGAENNIHMLLDSPDPHYRDWIMQKPEERFHKFGGYCFYVKE